MNQGLPQSSAYFPFRADKIRAGAARCDPCRCHFRRILGFCTLMMFQLNHVHQHIAATFNERLFFNRVFGGFGLCR